MLLRIPSVLDRQQLNRVKTLLASARFVDGRLSAGMAARRVKKNEELPEDAAQLAQLNDLVMGQLVRHPVYLNGALPQRIALLRTLHVWDGLRRSCR